MTTETTAAQLKPVEPAPKETRAPQAAPAARPEPRPEPPQPWPTMSSSIAALSAALAKAQGMMRCAPANQLLKVHGERANFEKPYADLGSIWDTIRDPLAANGLAVLQPVTISGTAVRCRTILTHSSGEWIAAELQLVAENGSPQKIGIAISYARRYGLSAMVGVAQAEYAEEPPGAKRQKSPAHDPATGICPPEDDDRPAVSAYDVLAEGLGDARTAKDIEQWGASVKAHEAKGRLSAEQLQQLRDALKARREELHLAK